MSIRAEGQAAAPSEEHCIAIKPGRLTQSKQGHHVFEGISTQSTGARALCMHVVAIPPGGRARAHLHEAHESAVYVVEGEVICWYGDRLQYRITAPIPTSRRASCSCPSSTRWRTPTRRPTSSTSRACGADAPPARVASRALW